MVILKYTEQDLRDAFRACEAFRMGSHKNFEQSHPGIEYWLRLMKTNLAENSQSSASKVSLNGDH